MKKLTTKQAGFSLVEIAIVLVIIGLMTVGGANLISMKREQALYAESDIALKQTKQAMLTYVVVNGHLPCPDTNDDGNEDRGTFQCSGDSGAVPYLTIGLNLANVKDPWGSVLRYNVNTNADVLASVNDNTSSASYFNANPVIPAGEKLHFRLNTPPSATVAGANNLMIEDGNGNNVASNQIAVLVAYNSNGLRTLNSCASTDVQEQENCDGDRIFNSVPHRLQDVSFFDDTVISISANEIKSAILRNNPQGID